MARQDRSIYKLSSLVSLQIFFFILSEGVHIFSGYQLFTPTLISPSDVIFRGLNLADYHCRTDGKPGPIYDLYAVINHYGGLWGGHYTAFAKTTRNRKEYPWRCFDDSSVTDIREDEVVTSDAYILFYRLRES